MPPRTATGSVEDTKQFCDGVERLTEDVDMEKVANGNKAAAADGCTQAVVEQQNQLLREEVKLLHEEIDEVRKATLTVESWLLSYLIAIYYCKFPIT